MHLKRNLTRTPSVLIAASLGVALQAQSISLSATSAEAKVGAQTTLSVTITYTGSAQATDLDWTIQETNAGTLGTATVLSYPNAPSQLVVKARRTYNPPERIGTFHITVTHRANPTASVTFPVTVQYGPAKITRFATMGDTGALVSSSRTLLPFGSSQTLLGWLLGPNPVDSLMIEGSQSNAISVLGQTSRTEPVHGRTIFTLTAANAYGLPSAAKVSVGVQGNNVLAGSVGGPGSLDGLGALARFNCPDDVAYDSAGNLYVSDRANRLIRKITREGSVSTLAGGTAWCQDGQGTSAGFGNLGGLTATADGTLYVADQYSVRRVTPDGTVTTLAGDNSQHGWVDDLGPNARFHYVGRIKLDGNGSLLLCDRINKVIRKVDLSGVVTTYAGKAGIGGQTNGALAEATFENPWGLEVAQDGTVYVGDQGSIRRIRNGAVDTIASNLVYVVQSLAIDRYGNIIYSHPGKNAVYSITPETLSNSWFFGSGYGQPGYKDAWAQQALLADPGGMAVSPVDGTLAVADRGNHSIRVLDHGCCSVRTLAGAGVEGGYEDGLWGAARFSNTAGLCYFKADGKSYLMVADSYNGTIRSIDLNKGAVTTVAGNHNAPFASYADGQGSEAHFSLPGNLVRNATGDTYVIDRGSGVIRKITTSGYVSTFAGTPGVQGLVDGQGASALFNHPEGITLDPSGNLYIADTMNNAIRKITPTGVVSTIAGGIIPGNTNGIGSNARFNQPVGVAYWNGALFVSDSYNRVIRRLAPTSTGSSSWYVSNLLMTGTPVVNGWLGCVAMDSNNGYLYVAAEDSVVRRLAIGGIGAPAPTANFSIATTFAAGIQGPSKGTRPGDLPGDIGTVKGMAVNDQGDLLMAVENGVLINVRN